MKKKYKKIYVEITNICNLKCSFCSDTKRELKHMSKEDFEKIIFKIKDYTDYIYLHVKGEPLLSPYLDDILSICDQNKITVNITTNGTLIKEREKVLIKHKALRQINISLHSENNKKDYLKDIFKVVEVLSKDIYISYRIWTLVDNTLDDKSKSIIKELSTYYKVDLDSSNNNYKLRDNVFLNKEELFEWPKIQENKSYNGFCNALKTHVAILVDGTVVPCCLDSEGEISLGNIFKDSLDNIINSKRYKDIEKGFKSNKSVAELCKSCNFRNRNSV